VEFSGNEPSRPEALLILFVADASRLTEAELKAMARARELLPKAIEGLEMSAEDKEALLRALGRKRKKDPLEKEQPSMFAEFRIVGVFREMDRKKDGDLIDLFDDGLDGQVVLPRDTSEKLFARLPNRANRGFQRAIIIVDSDENLKEVCDRLSRRLSLSRSACRKWRKERPAHRLHDGLRRTARMTVAYLGIMNTMFTAVRANEGDRRDERSDRHILAMFWRRG
jgi:hypothetical protein